MLFWIVFILYFLFDVNYFLRAVYIGCKHKWCKKKLHILEELCCDGICLPTDLDMMFHMNNARYLRECDFSRIQFWFSAGLMDIKHRFPGASITLGFSTARYRKSIELFQQFTLKTKVLCWDDKAFYMQQTFVRKRDGFICAVVYLKQTLIKIAPSQFVEAATGGHIDSPPVPDEIAALIQCHQISSDNLRKES